MEIKRHTSIHLLVREMKKDLFGIDTNNPTEEVSLSPQQLTDFDFSSVCKKINIDKWKKFN
jgi:hypothetical protein